MNDWLGLALILAVVALALIAASRLGGPRREMTVEEFEERARGGGYTRAGLFALQEVLDPKAARAVAVAQDLKHGYYNKKRVPGDGDDEEEEEGLLTPDINESGAEGNSPAGGDGVESPGGSAEDESPVADAEGGRERGR